jgi:hypothetical protein
MSSNNFFLSIQAVIHEPVGGGETPLRCTAGLVFGISMDAELRQLPDPAALRICLRTADQQSHLAVPRRGDLVAIPGQPGSYRLLTTALLSHQVPTCSLLIKFYFHWRMRSSRA